MNRDRDAELERVYSSPWPIVGDFDPPPAYETFAAPCWIAGYHYGDDVRSNGDGTAWCYTCGQSVLLSNGGPMNDYQHEPLEPEVVSIEEARQRRDLRRFRSEYAIARAEAEGGTGPTTQAQADALREQRLRRLLNAGDDPEPAAWQGIGLAVTIAMLMAALAVGAVQWFT